MIRKYALAVTTLVVLMSKPLLANPHFEESEVPDGEPDVRASYAEAEKLDANALRAAAKAVMRVDVKWNSNADTFQIESIEAESSGTDAFVNASRYDDPHGSFKGRLIDPTTNQAIAYSVIGTGSAFKNLARVITLRFPMPTKAVRFELRAEHGRKGNLETVLTHDINPSAVTPAPAPPADLEVRLIRAATKSPKVIVNIYAEGYAAGRRDTFFQEARKIPAAFEQGSFPKQEYMEFRGVFSESRTALGRAQKLGLPVPVRDSFLGLYFPYWYDFGRYYHVVYPTSSVKYRRAIAAAPYDYPIALVDDGEYWGVGNFKELTAIPARSSKFNYLLFHEIGHFFGLNEEYGGGGPTELAFAPEIQEPWSQNITFQSSREQVKWSRFLNASTPVPTSLSSWSSGRWGVYPGGYADTPKPGNVYKPGNACMMDSSERFCAICSAAIEERVDIDLGLKSPPATGGSASCTCRAEGTQCGLFKGSEKLAWAQLHGSASCDQNFCDRYFKLTLTQSCQ